ncbi:hypothetical protein EU244_017370 [Rhodococcus qingshengii]|uniref:hypothetical protein n=1 Tax=Rhodococcus qingshengii TaxID=334542 RepID=UPI0010A5EE70|nr:hypothetical protein [Rhodococcus qingshengii]THJ73969.1 hypothetical protein EU244_00425 [Rhodococcus qingshengii]
MTNPYCKDGKHRLLDSYVVHMDELGTSTALGDYDDGALQVFLDRTQELRGALQWSGLQMDAFSDNVLIGAPLDDPQFDWEEGPHQLFRPVADHQFKAALQGVYIRGALARGPLYMNSFQVTGRALLTAYTLESRVAQVPRILATPEAISSRQVNINAFGGDPLKSPYSRDFAVDEDGWAFINYLHQAAETDDETHRATQLSTHAEHIEHNLKKFVEPSGIREKFVWLAHYHNWVCSTFFNQMGASDILLSLLLPGERQNPRKFQRLKD